ncbi:MAG: hypothetical protein FWE60_03740, partial [Oscillospiraceae bacterium]|nr:hypothetical protein [Oscillospiraceae bacterium]
LQGGRLAQYVAVQSLIHLLLTVYHIKIYIARAFFNLTWRQIYVRIYKEVFKSGKGRSYL